MRKIALAATRSSVATAVEGTHSNAGIEIEDMRNGMGAVATMPSASTAGTHAGRSATRSGMSARVGMSGMSAAMSVTFAGTSRMRAVTNETPNAGAMRVNIRREIGGNAGNRANIRPGSERKPTSVALGSEGKRASVTITAGASNIPTGNVTAHATIIVTTVIASIAYGMSVGRL